MSLTRHFKVITVLMPFYCLVSFSSARANNESLPAPITRQAIELYNQGRLADATSLQEKALKQEPSDWLTNAALSYMLWRQANVYEAIRQGREAARLAPRNPVILCNLGLMLQASDDCDEAIDCYRKAIDIEPTNFLPHLGTARCFILKGNEPKGIKLLTDMSKRENAGFDWYYRASETCLKIKQLELAERLIKSAIDIADKPEQKCQARNSLFLIKLRGKEPEQAKALYEDVFNDSPPEDAEIYVRAASSILGPDDTEKGKELLRLAVENLESIQNCKSFFQLGRIFQDKASEAKAESKKESWLEVARAAYSQASHLAPKESGYHLARADVLMQEGKLSEMTLDLKKASELNKSDTLPAFILENIDKVGQFKKANLRIEGLSCDCHLSKLLSSMTNLKGVAFVSASGRKVFEGFVIYAPSLVSIEDLLSNTTTAFLKALPPKKSAKPLTFEVLSEEPIEGLAKVFHFAREARYGPVLSFDKTLIEIFNRFNDIEPAIPWNSSYPDPSTNDSTTKI